MLSPLCSPWSESARGMVESSAGWSVMGVGVAVALGEELSSSGLGVGDGSAHKGLRATRSKNRLRLFLNTGSAFVLSLEGS